MKPIPEDEKAWVAGFFSGSNALRWEQVVSGNAPAGWLSAVTPWLDSLSDSPLDRPILLPVFAVDGTRRWYAMAASDHIAAQMLEEIRAFIGPSFSHFLGFWHTPLTTDESERVLQKRFGWRVLRIDANAPSDCGNIEKSVALYEQLLRRRPSVPDRVQRPFGMVRRDFDVALLAADARGAQQFLDEMVGSGRVGADQQRFLRIRLLAGLGRSEEIVGDRVLIESVMNLALPPQTIVDVVEALYENYIGPREHELDLSALVALFKQHIGRPYGSLFRERRGIRLPRVLRAFLLFEAGQEQRNDARCAAIAETYPRDDGNYELIERWLRASAPAGSGDRKERVRQAIGDEDYDLAATLAIEGLPQQWAYSALLRCASEVESSALSAALSDAIRQIDPGILGKLSERDRARYARFPSSPSLAPRPSAEANWLAWSENVTARTDAWAPDEVLSQAVLKWDPGAYSANPAMCAQLAELIGNAPEPAATIFRDALPLLVEFFVERPKKPVRAFIPLYSMLVRIIAWSGTVPAAELEIATSLTRASLAVGLDKDVYSECLQDLQEIIRANNAPVHLDWALGLAELLVLYPTQDAELRLRIFMTVFGICRAAAHRLSAGQRAVLEFLAKDYGCPESLAEIPAPEPSDVAGGRTEFKGVIGIYTLNEPAGQRARAAIAQLMPGATVELNSDLTASDRLRHLARTSDLFVFAWKTSTHQAFYCVKEARKDRNIIMPVGGGTASLVKSVLEGLHSLQRTLRPA
jgi:hypothetical protein